MTDTPSAPLADGTDQPVVGRCASCRHWIACPTRVPGGMEERICRMSNIIAKHPGMYGQDGRGVITEATFGCVNYAANNRSSVPPAASGGG